MNHERKKIDNLNCKHKCNWYSNVLNKSLHTPNTYFLHSDMYMTHHKYYRNCHNSVLHKLQHSYNRSFVCTHLNKM